MQCQVDCGAAGQDGLGLAKQPGVARFAFNTRLIAYCAHIASVCATLWFHGLPGRLRFSCTKPGDREMMNAAPSQCIDTTAYENGGSSEVTSNHSET